MVALASFDGELRPMPVPDYDSPEYCEGAEAFRDYQEEWQNPYNAWTEQEKFSDWRNGFYLAAAHWNDDEDEDEDYFEVLVDCLTSVTTIH